MSCRELDRLCLARSRAMHREPVFGGWNTLEFPFARLPAWVRSLGVYQRHLPPYGVQLRVYSTLAGESADGSDEPSYWQVSCTLVSCTLTAYAPLPVSDHVLDVVRCDFGMRAAQEDSVTPYHRHLFLGCKPAGGIL